MLRISKEQEFILKKIIPVRSSAKRNSNSTYGDYVQYTNNNLRSENNDDIQRTTWKQEEEKEKS